MTAPAGDEAATESEASPSLESRDNSGRDLKGRISDIASAESETWYEPTESAAEESCDDSLARDYIYNGCIVPDDGYYDGYYKDSSFYPGGEEYTKAEENGFSLAATEPLSTFSADVDTASYANVRRMILDGYPAEAIDPNAVRPEEFLNYFSYDLKEPKRGEKFGLTKEMSACPWNPDHELLMVGMKTKPIDREDAKPTNLVFLIDVSGSMFGDDRLGLLQKSFKELTKELNENDRVSIVTYASGVKAVLEGATGEDQKEIIAALDGLTAGGSTNGEGGLKLAYELAEENFIEDGNNRVILATDGDLNVGISSEDELRKFIEKKRKSGVYLSVLGFGTGNLKDSKMETLADYGNGNYSYIDSLMEARKVLVSEMSATLETVADDVKLQVEFNPAYVSAYRLIGYENRMLQATDFNDDTKDAGEIGAGHSVIALYEIIPAGSRDAISLKYGKNRDADDFDGEYATLSVRYKEPGEEKSKLTDVVIDSDDYSRKPGDDFLFASAVAEFAQILADSPNRGDATFESVMDLLRDADLGDDEYKEEFTYLVQTLLMEERRSN
ncbi:MAG: VWA domain-containing protein [Lachnospiraceae bacterium]|nr:VWA domain-containing protein [Lachnospiraceae bacterium]